jgi:prophage regulatory protein
MAIRFLSRDDLRARGITHSKTHLTRLVKQGLFPRPVKLGYSTMVWVETEIDEYQANKIAERDNQGDRARQEEVGPAMRPA